MCRDRTQQSSVAGIKIIDKRGSLRVANPENKNRNTYLDVRVVPIVQVEKLVRKSRAPTTSYSSLLAFGAA